jgi:hypothetical protein
VCPFFSFLPSLATPCGDVGNYGTKKNQVTGGPPYRPARLTLAGGIHIPPKRRRRV